MSVLLLALLLGTSAVQTPEGPPVVVGSKPFGESYVLAEMFAQLLEARGIRVERRLGHGATQIAFGALRSGAATMSLADRVNIFWAGTGPRDLPRRGFRKQPKLRAFDLPPAAAVTSR